MSDRLALANAIEDAGIPRDKAQRVASVIFDAIHDNVATKADLDRLATALKNTETALKTDINRVEFNLKAEITRQRDVMALRGIAVLATGLGALFAALHYWPPHG
jgi:predicted butyrate kinase (DUF1464 family)